MLLIIEFFYFAFIKLATLGMQIYFHLTVFLLNILYSWFARKKLFFKNSNNSFASLLVTAIYGSVDHKIFLDLFFPLLFIYSFMDKFGFVTTILYRLHIIELALCRDVNERRINR